MVGCSTALVYAMDTKMYGRRAEKRFSHTTESADNLSVLRLSSSVLRRVLDCVNVASEHEADALRGTVRVGCRLNKADKQTSSLLNPVNAIATLRNSALYGSERSGHKGHVK